MKIVVLINARAGALEAARAADELAYVREMFLAHGVEAEVRYVTGRLLSTSARQAMAAGPDAVVAGGGDGTISAVAGALAGSGIPLGILPLGTRNRFARDLLVPLALEQAAKVIADGRTRDVDMAEVNGRIFVNNCSIGIHPQAVADGDPQPRHLGRGRWLVALSAILGALRRYPLVRVRVQAEGRSIQHTTPFVFVGNNRYELGLFAMGRRLDLSGGALNLYLAECPGRFGALRLAWRALLGRLEQHRDFQAVCTPEAWIETRRRRLQMVLDGEMTAMAPPLHYRILPGALRVLVPPERQEVARAEAQQRAGQQKE